MSEGTRSGVNWSRAKSPPTTVAKLRTASVLATPGTPSSRMWPLASRPTISCSTMCSWPTITRWTWAMASPEQLGGLLVAQLSPPAALAGAGWWARRTTDCSRTLLMLRPRVPVPARRAADLHPAPDAAHSRRPRGPAYWLPQGGSQVGDRRHRACRSPRIRLSVPRTCDGQPRLARAERWRPMSTPEPPGGPPDWPWTTRRPVPDAGSRPAVRPGQPAAARRPAQSRRLLARRPAGCHPGRYRVHRPRRAEPARDGAPAVRGGRRRRRRPGPVRRRDQRDAHRHRAGPRRAGPGHRSAGPQVPQRATTTPSPPTAQPAAPWAALAYDGSPAAAAEADADPRRGAARHPAAAGHAVRARTTSSTGSQRVRPGLARLWPLPWPGRYDRAGWRTILVSWLLMLLLAALAVLIAILIFRNQPPQSPPPPTGSSGSPPPQSELAAAVRSPRRSRARRPPTPGRRRRSRGPVLAVSVGIVGIRAPAHRPRRAPSPGRASPPRSGTLPAPRRPRQAPEL